MKGITTALCWNSKCIVFQRHGFGQIFPHTETHADPEKVASYKTIPWFSLFWGCSNSNDPHVLWFHLQLLPAVPACGGREYGLWQVSELRSNAADSRRPHYSLWATLLCKGSDLQFLWKQHFKKFISFDNMLTSVKNFSFYQSFHHKIWLKAKHFKMCFFFFDYLTRDVYEHLISICPQDVVGCVCVNPGRLTKGQVGGTYGRLLVQRRAAAEDGSRVSPCLAAQVVKI